MTLADSITPFCSDVVGVQVPAVVALMKCSVYTLQAALPPDLA